MTDTITESFCERCGTRYSLEPPTRRRRGGIGRVRVLTRGLRNYVTNDGMPMAEAMAAARQDEERSSVTQQLDAFHEAFNFCLTCRQYTCANCWNAKAGECLTCAPDLSLEVLPPAFPDLPAAGPGPAPTEPADATAWPRVDLDRAALGGNGAAEEAPGLAVEVAFIAPPPEPAAEPSELAAIAPPAPEPVAERAELAAIASQAPEGSTLEELTPDELAAVESALAAAHATAPPAEAPPEGPPAIAAGEPGVALPAAEAAPETGAEAPAEDLAPVAAAPEPVPEVAPGIAPEAVAGLAVTETVEEPAPPAAPVAPEDRIAAGRRQTRSLLGRFRPGRAATSPLPQVAPGAPAVGASATPAPAAAPAPEPAATQPPAAAEPAALPAPPTPPPADTVEQPTWRITAPDTTPGAPAGWPEGPAWPAPSLPPPQAPGPAASPWASRLASSRPEAAVWAASSQEVLGAPGPAGRTAPPAVQACVSCGLSLSANARFCRRCGSRQG